jgi:hypothetical protein
MVGQNHYKGKKPNFRTIGDKVPFGTNTGFNAPCEPSRWKVEDLLTGFTFSAKSFNDSLW